jgi:hypothetical protein
MSVADISQLPGHQRRGSDKAFRRGMGRGARHPHEHEPTIYGGGESLLAQSAEHLRTRKAFHRLQRRPHLAVRRSGRSDIE